MGGMYIQSGLYNRVDEFARSIPTAAINSISDLAHYISHHFEHESEKSRAAFTWIATHIAYDCDALATGIYPPSDPSVVMRRRQGICSGYARLYEALIQAMSMKAHMVTGYARNTGDQVEGSSPMSENHAWNAVCINGTWQLLDLTWSAGFVNSSRQCFERYFTDYYYETPARHFITTHFPLFSRWQLLYQPVSWQRFTEMVHLTPRFFCYGLYPESHRCYRINVSSPVKMLFSCPRDVVIKADLKLTGMNQDELQLETGRKGNTCYVDVTCSQNGKFKLNIYAGRNESKFIDLVAVYQVERYVHHFTV